MRKGHGLRDTSDRGMEKSGQTYNALRGSTVWVALLAVLVTGVWSSAARGDNADESPYQRYKREQSGQGVQVLQLQQQLVDSRALTEVDVSEEIKGAGKGDALSEYKLGLAYEKGLGVTKDPLEAAWWYRKAGMQLNEDALKALAALYVQNPGIRKQGDELYAKAKAYEKEHLAPQDLGQVFSMFSQAAKYGSSFAMYWLGYAALHGIGVDKDPMQATFWYGQGAAEGEKWCQYEYAAMYDTRQGGPAHDLKFSKAWYVKSANQMCGDSLQRLTEKGITPDAGERVSWAYKLAAGNDAEGMYRLAQMYEKGEGVERDVDKAHEWYMKAGVKDHKAGMEALVRIGRQIDDENAAKKKNDDDTASLMKYYHDEIARKDPARALAQYRENAEKGSAPAQYYLAGAIANGEGVPKNKTLAHRWYENAANGDYAPAQALLAQEYESQGDKALACKWYIRAGANSAEGMDRMRMENRIPAYTKNLSFIKKSSDEGNLDSTFILGLVNQYGLNLMKSEEYAVGWYQVSAKAGHKASQQQLAAINTKGGPERDISAAVNYYKEGAMKNDVAAQMQLIRIFDRNLATGDAFLDPKKFPATRKSWLEGAANKGNDEAQFILGTDVEKKWSEGGKRDKKLGAKAASWYRKSAEQGNMDAIRKLKEFK